MAVRLVPVRDDHRRADSDACTESKILRMGKQGLGRWLERNLCCKGAAARRSRNVDNVDDAKFLEWGSVNNRGCI